MPTRSRNSVILFGLLAAVAGVVLLAHWPALSSRAISFDDRGYLVNNPLVRNPSWASVGRFLGEVRAPSTVKGYYQPLAMISLMVDCAMGDSSDNLVPFHRTSLLLHVANTVLIGVLLYVLLGNAWAAAMAALLFGVHPMTVEPIPWIGERKTVLATCFVLWSLLAYVQYARTRRAGWYMAAVGTFVLALLSKPTATPLPLLLVLLDAWPLNRLNRRTLTEKVPFLVIAGAFAAITYVSQHGTAGTYDPGEASRWRVPLILCHNIVFYLWKIVWPVKLSSHYPFPEPMNLSQPMVLAGVVGTVVLLAVLAVSLRWTRAPAVGWLFFFVAILPTMGIVGFTVVIASDKYAYLPAFGLLMVLAALLDRLWRESSNRVWTERKRWVTVAVVSIVCGLELTATRAYLRYWRDSETLALHMWSCAPNSAVAHNNLAVVLSSQGKLAEASVYYREAIRLKPSFAEAHNNLGLALASQKKMDQAIVEYNTALRLKPDYAEAHRNLGFALAGLGEWDAAISQYKEAMRLRRDYAQAHSDMGNALAAKGNCDEAIRECMAAVRIDPHSPVAHNDLAAVLYRCGRSADAIEEFRTSADLDKNYSQPRFNLGAILMSQGHTAEAADWLRQVVRIQPDHAQARAMLQVLATQPAKP